MSRKGSEYSKKQIHAKILAHNDSEHGKPKRLKINSPDNSLETLEKDLVIQRLQ